MKKSGHQLANENEAKYGVILSVLRKKPTSSMAEIKSNPAWKWDTSPSGPSIGKAKQELGIWRQNGKAKVPMRDPVAERLGSTPSDDGLSEFILEAADRDAETGSKLGVCSQAAKAMAFIVQCGGYKKALALLQETGESIEKLLK